ncbi:hypothetical protein ABQF34_29015 [Mycolicibacterium boenickei]
MTAKKDTKKIAALLEEESAAIDADRDAPITEATTVTRGHGRSKTLQIRLNPEELEELERVAATRGLPTSTVAREAILRLIHPAEVEVAAREHLVDAISRYCDDVLIDSDAKHSHIADQGMHAVNLRVGKHIDLALVQSGEHGPTVASELMNVMLLTQTLNRNMELLMERFHQVDESIAEA